MNNKPADAPLTTGALAMICPERGHFRWQQRTTVQHMIVRKKKTMNTMSTVPQAGITAINRDHAEVCI
jgi:hypothetical protein